MVNKVIAILLNAALHLINVIGLYVYFDPIWCLIYIVVSTLAYGYLSYIREDMSERCWSTLISQHELIVSLSEYVELLEKDKCDEGS